MPISAQLKGQGRFITCELNETSYALTYLPIWTCIHSHDSMYKVCSCRKLPLQEHI